MHTDELGLGAVLYQIQDDGKKRPIAFASRNLTKAESRYHSSRLEFLALRWSVVEHFHEYLYGSQFDVYTDNNPLTYVLSSAKLDATGQRWVASLANYDFKIYYKSGKVNTDADALSRIVWSEVDPVLAHAIITGSCESRIPLVPSGMIQILKRLLSW